MNAKEIREKHGIHGLMKHYEFENGGYYNELDKKQNIIELQEKIIKEYEDTLYDFIADNPKLRDMKEKLRELRC